MAGGAPLQVTGPGACPASETHPGPHIVSAPNCAHSHVPPSSGQAAGRAGAAALRQPSEDKGGPLPSRVEPRCPECLGAGGGKSPQPHTQD